MNKMMTWLGKGAILLAFILALEIVSGAQITGIPTFTTSVTVAQLNSALATIADGALKRNGGTITGNITVNSSVTIDGVDISAALGGSGNGQFATIDTSNTGAESIDAAGGIEAGTGNVEIIGTDGRIPAISSTYFASLSGANLTGIPSNTAMTTTWATPTYAGGDYTTNGAGGWTVDSGDIVSFRYMEIGKTMYMNVVLTTTTVTAATGSQLKIKIPNSRTAASLYSGPFNGLNNAVAFSGGVWQTGTADAQLYLYVDPTLGTSWTAAANATQLRVNAVFEIQ